jgi:hypothetical protein
MRGLVALFIWIGIPMILMDALDLSGTLWTFILCGVFGVVALFFYGMTSKGDA